MSTRSVESKVGRRRGRYRKHEAWVKDLIALSGKWNLFPELGIPRSTADSWVQGGYQGCDSKLESFAEHYMQLSDQVGLLARNITELQAQVRIIRQAYQALGLEINCKKIQSREKRLKILDLIESAMREKVPRALCLAAIGLSLSRYKRWRREGKKCRINPAHTCLRNGVSQLTPKELRKMRYFVTSKKFAHFPIKALCLYAKKTGKLFCVYSTWLKYIHALGWLRPKRRRKPKIRRKIGIRAKHPNEVWHLDVTQVVLPNRRKYYIQAIVDNYSRYVLAWHVSHRYSGVKTTKLILRALRKGYALKGLKVPEVYVDGGGENNNARYALQEAVLIRWREREITGSSPAPHSLRAWQRKVTARRPA